MKPLLEVHHVEVRFPREGKSVQVLRDISLEVFPGELITVIGESGCGKSTLGKICLGTLRPSRGAVFYQGEFIWDKEFSWTPELRLLVQVIHQDPFSSLNPVRTIYQTLSTPFEHYRLTTNSQETRQKVAELVESVGLAPAENFLEKYPFQLSGGQKQRVSIARAMILKPKLIVADEPVSGVDASSRLNILGLMKKLNSDHGMAFLYITHDLVTAKFFAPHGRMIVMYLGRMVETGVVSHCVDNPRHPYLRALLAAIQAERGAAQIPLKAVDLPSLLNPPTGCTFHPRCPYNQGICEKEEPELVPLDDDPHRFVACHFAKEIAGATMKNNRMDGGT